MAWLLRIYLHAMHGAVRIRKVPPDYMTSPQLCVSGSGFPDVSVACVRFVLQVSLSSPQKNKSREYSDKVTGSLVSDIFACLFMVHIIPRSALLRPRTSAILGITHHD